jgi:hypothetical protein
VTSRLGTEKWLTFFYSVYPLPKFSALSKKPRKVFQRKKNELINFLYGLSVRSAHEQTSKKEGFSSTWSEYLLRRLGI